MDPLTSGATGQPAEGRTLAGGTSPETGELKRCSKCGEEKPRGEFNRQRDKKDGLRTTCRQCQKQAATAYYQKNKDAVCEKRRARHAAHPEKQAEWGRGWRQRNPERARELSRASDRRNAEKRAERWRAYYAANRERMIRRVVDWANEHPEMKAANDKRYRISDPERTRTQSKSRHHRRRAAKLALPNERVDTAFVLFRDAGICGICEEPVDPEDWHLDHVIPLSRGGHHTYANVQVAHPSCNLRKGSRLPEEC